MLNGYSHEARARVPSGERRHPYAAVTTCNAAIWEESGARMVDTFARLWPESIPLYLYAEGPMPSHSRPVALEPPAWLGEFLLRHMDEPEAHGRKRGGYDFRQDAARFAHKAAALAAAGWLPHIDRLIWLDADIVTHELVTTEWLDELFPRPSRALVAWLDRENLYPETGFMIWNCRHPRYNDVMLLIEDAYRDGKIFDLKQTHDAFVLQHIVERAGVETISLSGEARRTSHPLVNGPLGARLDHLKGPRKALGRSKASDLKVKRTEPYWR